MSRIQLTLSVDPKTEITEDALITELTRCLNCGLGYSSKLDPEFTIEGLAKARIAFPVKDWCQEQTTPGTLTLVTAAAPYGVIVDVMGDDPLEPLGTVAVDYFDNRLRVLTYKGPDPDEPDHSIVLVEDVAKARTTKDHTKETAT